MKLKLEAARRQLGTALWLYLEGLDPVSVHCLAGGGAEVSMHYAKKQVGNALLYYLASNQQEHTVKALTIEFREFWNAFKHATERGDRAPRDDEALLRAFSDERNDIALFVGWVDYSNAAASMPIEAQVFTAVYHAALLERAGERLTKDEKRILGRYNLMTRSEKRVWIKQEIAHGRAIYEVMTDIKTDVRPLVLPWADLPT